MKSHWIILCVVVSILFSCKNSGNENKSSLQTFADSLFNIHVDSSNIAGATVIVFQQGKTLLNESYGYASLELSVPMPENASFEIGSVTKQFTAAAILKLVEEGKLSLDDDFTQYMDFDTKGRKVTIDQLLNHTSGISSYTEISAFWDLSVHGYERDSLVRLVEKEDFLFEPGEALIYNNSGYYFLGLIIEKVSGMTYEEYLSEQIFEPLGMNDTYYCSTSKVVKNKVYGYGYSPDGLQQKAYLDHTWPYAAGSLCSTTSDLLTWMKALHNGDVLSDESYNSLITPRTLNDGSQLRYAMGLSNFINFGNSTISHGGGINGFLSDTRYFPESDLYVVCLVNTTGPQGAGFFASQLSWQLLTRTETEGVELDIDTNSLIGTYSGQARGRVITVEVGTAPDAITTSMVGRDAVDTLTTYIGNNTWRDGNDIIKIENGELRIDQVGGYYILKL